MDEQVRYFVAPSLEDIQNSPVSHRKYQTFNFVDSGSHSQLRPYVDVSAKLSNKQRNEIFGKLPHGGLTAEHYFNIAPRTKNTATGSVSSLLESLSL